MFNWKWWDKYEWLRFTNVVKRAKCVVCQKTFDVSNVSEHAVLSHMNGAKHKSLMSFINKKMSYFIRSSESCEVSSSAPSGTGNADASVAIVPGPSQPVISSGASNIYQFSSSNDVLKAEVLWTLHVVVSHGSYNSCSHASQMLRKMFPDSNIAAKFSCGPDKTTYLAVFEIAPFYSELLKKKIVKSNEYVLLFDESLNGKSQKKQLDVHVRHWNNNVVKTF